MSKRYDKYIESGVEWINEFPSSWELVKFKRFAKIRNGKDQKEVAIDEGGYPILGSGGEFGRSSQFIHDKPSVLLGRKGTINKPQFIQVPFWTVDTLFYTDINNDVNPKYLFYLSQQIPFDLLQESSAVPSMTQEKLNSVYLVKPSLIEQTKIAQYLDHQTAIIDQLIQQKEKLIELLKEKRQAVINEAVTKGLNPNAKMKDSGIEWLGVVPLNWNIIKLRFLCQITTGGKDTENREDDGEYPFFVRSQTIERISTFSFDGEAILTAGDGVGVCKVWHYIVGKFDFHQRVYMMHDFKGIKGKYLFYYMKENFINDVLKLSAKSTVDSLRRPMFLDFKVLVPPSIEEQNSIVEYIEKFEKNIVLLIDDEQTAIEKLKEFRQSIISEAVTGKIDVRDWQPNKQQVA